MEPSNAPNTYDLIKLREIIARGDYTDLRIFCADLNEDYNAIVGEGKTVREAALALVKYFENRGRTGELVERVKREFPSAEWAAVIQPKIVGSATITQEGHTLTASATVSRAPGPLRVFLCHASPDKAKALELHTWLKAMGAQPWLDEEDLIPGQDWRNEIRRAVQNSDVVLVCLSQQSVNREGFIKDEIGFALNQADRQADGAIFVVPLRLDECEVPERLARWHWVNWFDARGPERLQRALRRRADEVDATWAVAEPTNPDVPRDAARGSDRRDPIPDTVPPPIVIAPQPTLPKTFTLDDPILMEFVLIPAGPFLMGSDRSKDKAAFDDELPQHRLTLPDYYMGKYEVTNAQWQIFARASKRKFNLPRAKESHPVVNVNWHEAFAFCDWLTQMSGYELMLPSEAEWEKAARGVDGYIYPWGNDPLSTARANHGDMYGNTTPVGRYSPDGDSPYGCTDMSGNVFEWTRSLWGKEKKPEFVYPYTNRMTEREALTASGIVRRVLRGGSWDYFEDNARPAYRLRYQPSFRSSYIGFRLACGSALLP